MRWYMDTEFNEDGRTIELISIALVSESGASVYYAASSEFDPEKCNDWVKANVLPKLPPPEKRITRAQIARDIAGLLRPETEKPEIWGYFADYDWVVFCQLFGPMVALPTGMPFYCRDLKQLMDQVGITREELPPDGADEHNALADARWIRSAHRQVERMMLDGIARSVKP